MAVVLMLFRGKEAILEDRYMNVSLIDEYVYLTLIDNGWIEKRDFLSGDCIENYLNMLFVKGRNPQKTWAVNAVPI